MKKTVFSCKKYVSGEFYNNIYDMVRVNLCGKILIYVF